MSTETRMFPTLDVVTVSTGTLVAMREPPKHPIDAVYELCGFMLGDTLMTHQLPGAAEVCEAALIAQHPWLADLKPPRGDKAALLIWCDGIITEHGAELPVTAIDDPSWQSGNALQDLLDIADGRPVIAVNLGGEDKQQ